MLSTQDQILAVALVGETANGDLRTVVQTIATHYNYDARYPGKGLDMLYVQRELIKVALASARRRVSITTADQRIEGQQEGIRLQAMLADVQAEIVRIEQLARSSSAPVVGMITATVPEPVPFSGGLSADDVALRGSPYYAYPGGNGTLPVVRD